MTVTVRPWRQQLNGTVVADPRSNLTRYVRATTRSFTIGAGVKRPISFRMVRRLSSLYASVDILGKPTNTKGRKGIIPNYRLISKLRLNPAKKTYKFRTGAAQVRSGAIILPVRNLGNSIDPIGGTFRLSGAGSQVRQHGRDRRPPGQARRPEPRLHARDEEGHATPSTRRSSRAASPPTCVRASRSASRVRTLVERGVRLHARSDTDQVRSRRGRRRRLGVATPGRDPGVARDGPGHPARRARPCVFVLRGRRVRRRRGSSRRSTRCRPPRTSRCRRRSTGSSPLGGGSAIDTAKVANLIVSHPAPVMDYVNAPIGGGRAPDGPLRPAPGDPDDVRDGQRGHDRRRAGHPRAAREDGDLAPLPAAVAGDRRSRPGADAARRGGGGDRAGRGLPRGGVVPGAAVHVARAAGIACGSAALPGLQPGRGRVVGEGARVRRQVPAAGGRGRRRRGGARGDDARGLDGGRRVRVRGRAHPARLRVSDRGAQARVRPARLPGAVHPARDLGDRDRAGGVRVHVRLGAGAPRPRHRAARAARSKT